MEMPGPCKGSLGSQGDGLALAVTDSVSSEGWLYLAGHGWHRPPQTLKTWS